MDLSYILNQLGEDREQYFNAVAPPIVQTSNFSFNSVADFRKAMSNEFEANLYSRGNNPTINILRKKLAALDGAEDALVFGSGVAAIAIPIIALLKSGDHIVCVENSYSWTIKLFTKLLPRFGVTCTFVDGTELKNFEAAIRPETKLIYLESPNTFSYELQDLAAIAQLAKSRGILTMIDNSYCTPLYQQPIKLGIDLVAQSATKYIGGHSDVVAGVVTGSKALLSKIFELEYMGIGASMAPQSAWLLIRGLRTLSLRLQRSFESTKIITARLQQHAAVDQVIWPFLPSFKQAELAHQQMQGCGGLFSFTLKNSSLQKIEAFCDALQHMLMAVSWGGHESLIIPAIATIAADDYDANNYRHQLIRMYVGLEDAEYLITDMEGALSALKP
ncbi:trans-sulfuration enzyme family protein [Mucilaginibacter myungsuensis]|uniref:Aminotransferase class I/II-fold pyridoxal phosphate-dependent enzyme n=1 Tax=Mucilaginibacter myungsuensis TaxID=649104 RepID=A0A929KZ46_9SPHI|nr:aminotransferase class I/II-fold pyridoxal phosphate-dependent enzyme [Mucilaginibacter myungsuensis]MBE9662603.1 aminotransferase class I/II-fold pyridoxal phosphate-dependent enzyme [Mucilaginibacter myungsuensis]MDN3598023.1 aminotransferase class I/II-fold pyridoxal phosphate-dependent enzyme [Mucilaginibacter myungsuensis]